MLIMIHSDVGHVGIDISFVFAGSRQILVDETIQADII